MSELRVGIVGLGWVAGAHIEAVQASRGARVHAVCSQRRPTPAAVAAHYGLENPVVYGDYQEMLADPDIDVVSLCSVNALHPSQAIAAIQAGKHVYIEKPIALSQEQAKAIYDAWRGGRVKVCVGFECRFSQQLTLLKAVIDKGLIGDIHYGEADYYHGIGPWYGQFHWSCRRDGGGSSLLSGGCHALDALLLAMDAPVLEVSSYASQSKAECFREYEFPSCSVSILKFADGKVGKVTSSVDCLQPYYFHFQFLGSKGSILDNKFCSRALPGLSQDKWTTLETVLLDSGDVLDHPYQPQFQAFFDSIRNDSPMPLTGMEQAYQTHRVIFAAEKSLQLGRPVQMSEIPN
jgi:predicted dehydrogenase